MDLKEDGNRAFLAGDFDAASQLYDEAQASTDKGCGRSRL
jgi:hypothetical protein